MVAAADTIDGGLGPTITEDDVDVIITEADLLLNDGGNVNITGFDDTATLGSLSWSIADPNDFTYTPTGGQFQKLGDGETKLDTFVYTSETGGGVTTTATVTIVVTGVNDAPTLKDNDPLFVEWFDTETIDNTLLRSVDIDGPNKNVIYTIDDATDRGDILLNGSVLGVGDTFTQKQVNEGKVEYEHTGPAGFTKDSFDFTITDPHGADGGSFTFDIDITQPIDVFTINGTNGDDTINGDDDKEFMLGKGGNDSLSSGHGDDVIKGGKGNDTLWGDLGEDTLFGNAGNDSIGGSQGNDYILGGGGNDTLFGDSGDDTIFGGGGHDMVFGANGLNVLYGGGGNDTIYGGDDEDTIFGDKGNDELFGAGGADHYHFEKGHGHDTLWNFDVNAGDVIHLKGFGQITTFADVLGRMTEDGFGNTVLNTPGGGNSITIIGTQISDFGLDDFLF